MEDSPCGRVTRVGPIGQVRPSDRLVHVTHRFDKKVIDQHSKPTTIKLEIYQHIVSDIVHINLCQFHAKILS